MIEGGRYNTAETRKATHTAFPQGPATRHKASNMYTDVHVQKMDAKMIFT